MIDVLLLAVLGVVTWCVASDGAWSAVVTFLCTLIAGLIAMNFFEPVAILLEGISPFFANRADMIALLGLFIAALFALRVGFEQLVKLHVEVAPMAHEPIRWAFAFFTGYVSMAFLLTALHTAPLPREFLGFRAERPNFLGLAAPDRQWLGLTQFVSEHALSRGDGHSFDTARMKVASYPNSEWSSFPIRYATRRERFSTGMGAAAAPAQPVTTPGAPVTTNPGF
jgi:hypothetical protein